MIVSFEDNLVSYTLSNFSVTSLPMRNSYMVCQAEPYINFLSLSLLNNLALLYRAIQPLHIA